jgi:hypothetical protein
VTHLIHAEAADVTHGDLIYTILDEEQARDELYDKLSDYYDGSIEATLKYFRKRHRETNERFADRPKISWPLGRTVCDVHASAISKKIKTEVLGDERTAMLWEENSDHNTLNAFYNQIATTVSVYGAAGVKPIVHDDGTRQKVIEWELHPPDSMKFLYERSASGRSVKRFLAVVIRSGYSLVNGATFPWPVMTHERMESLKIKLREEIITPDQWIVKLDGIVRPISPITGEVWMPTENGVNPYGMIPVALFNGKEVFGDFLGVGDLTQSVDDIQNINELWRRTVIPKRTSRWA